MSNMLRAEVSVEGTRPLLWDRTVVSRKEMEAVIRDAGQLVGLADGRAVGFGRFILQGLEAEEL